MGAGCLERLGWLARWRGGGDAGTFSYSLEQQGDSVTNVSVNFATSRVTYDEDGVCSPSDSTATPGAAFNRWFTGSPLMLVDSRAVISGKVSVHSSPMMTRPAVTSPMNSMYARAKPILT